MHRLFPTLLIPLLALTACAHPEQQSPQALSFATFSQEIEAPPSVVRENAFAYAQENRYLRGIADEGTRTTPPALVSGDLLLHFHEAPFTLYLRPTNHHTKAFLKSQKIDLSKQERQEAQSFLHRLSEQVARNRTEG